MDEGGAGQGEETNRDQINGEEERKGRRRRRGRSRVNRTVGNRSGSGSVRYETGQNSKFKFEFKKLKFSNKFLKILQVATNLMVSNFFKYLFI